MPNINLRLSEQEHAELREWAHGSRRSIQREIVFRLFDGGVTERGGGGVVGTELRADGSDAGSIPAVARSPRSVTPSGAAVTVRPHMRRDMPAVQCPTRIVSGMCPDCGKYL